MPIIKRKVHILLFVLFAMITLGIGYAAISNILLTINSTRTVVKPNQSNFKVEFLDEEGARPSIEGSPTNNVSITSETVASFDITTLSKTDDSVTATLKVKNSSNGMGALIGLNLTNSNPEFFKVTETILDNSLQAGEKTTVTVKVEMIKTPINDSISTSITASLIATPIENTASSGGDTKTEVNPNT